jgi:hypothetical protein
MITLRTKFLAILSAALLVAFFVLITEPGQVLLRGRIPVNAHFELDDIYMGAGLFPYVYCLVPGFIVSMLFGLSFA